MSDSENEQLRAAELRRRALEMRLEGHGYREIADALDVSEPSAWKMVGVELQGLQATTQDVSRRYRDEQIERLDVALRAIWPDVQAGKPEAVACLVQLEDRRSQLLGLDSPAVAPASEPASGR